MVIGQKNIIVFILSVKIWSFGLGQS